MRSLLSMPAGAVARRAGAVQGGPAAPGGGPGAAGREGLRWHGEQALSTEVAEASAVFGQFVENTREARVAQSNQSVRRAADLLVDDLTDRIGLSRMLTHAEHGK